jgi:2-C-methyl-D-erythritol 4-phosphate cytidylyltransferase
MGAQRPFWVVLRICGIEDSSQAPGLTSGVGFAIMGAWAIVPAAGEGARLGGPGPKAFHPVAGMPLIAHSLVVLAKSPSISRIIVAAPAEWSARLLTVVAGTAGDSVDVVAGGESRQASVRAALASVTSEHVLVHDAARPLVTVDLVEAVLAALSGAAASICAVPISDTLKRVKDGRVVSTVDRESLWRVQTPQAFDTAVLRRAHDDALAASFEGTDDAALVERLGEAVAVVPGDERNIKVTTPADLALAETLLAAR